MKNKLFGLLSTLALVVLSGTPLFTKSEVAANAALTAPTSYDYAYRYDGTRFAYETPLGAAQAYFTRTADGAYYNYSTDYTLVDGLDITMTFNRSNTSWTFTTPFGYRATDTKIGSDNTVGTVVKFSYVFDNQTNKDYQLYLDVSSSGGYSIEYIWNVESLGTGTYTLVNSSLQRFIIPSFTKIELKSTSTAATRYFDAWYLKDLGVSDAYQQGEDDGYDIGYEDGYNNSASPLWDGLEVVVGVTVNFILFIMTLSIFDISLLNIGIVLVSILGIVWVLKALRG